MENRSQKYQLTAGIAGFTLIFYIVAGLSGMAFSQASPGRVIISLLTSLSALILGVTFYSITCKQQRDIAMLGLVCRVVEAVPGEGTFFFAMASTLFSWLLLRGRMVPVPLSLLGVIASALLVVFLPIQYTGKFGGAGNWSSPVTWVMWIPMLVFEFMLAVRLIIKGINLHSNTN